MRKSVIFLILVGLLALPSFGQFYEKETGFFVDIGTWYVQPDNSFQLAKIDNSEANTGKSYEGIAFDFDEGVAPRIEFGYKTGEFGDFSLSYWTYEEDADGINKSGQLQFTADVHNYFTSGNNLVYEGNTDSWRAEFKWGNTFGADQGSWSGEYFLGLRGYDYSQQTYLRMEGTDETGNDLAVDWSYLNESEGLGLSGGIEGSYRFNDIISLYGNIGTVVLRADNSYTSNYVFDYNNNDPIKEEFEYSDEIVTQYDLSLGVEFDIIAGLQADVGYRLSSWENTGTDIYGFENEDIGWDGVYLNIGYTFGGGAGGTGTAAPGW